MLTFRLFVDRNFRPPQTKIRELFSSRIQSKNICIQSRNFLKEQRYSLINAEITEFVFRKRF